MANIDWGIGYQQEASQAQIDFWEDIKSRVSKIASNLYLSGFPDELVQREMKRLGIKTVISCTHAEPSIDSRDVLVIRVPFDDDARALPPDDYIAGIVNDANAAMNDGEPVLVHCLYGLNRSALIAAHVLADRDPSLSGSEILAMIRKARPGTLHNELFADAVRKLNA